MTRRILLGAAALAAVLALPAPPAQACSRDDQGWFDSFPDASCLLERTSTEIDTLGGLRLVTNGSPTHAVWDTDDHLTTGVTYQSKAFAPVDRAGLDVTGGALELGATDLPLTPAAEPVLGPSPSAVLDNDNVDDPTVVKAGSTYTMFYSGTAEDGRGPAIFCATSPDGRVWSRPAQCSAPVLEGTDGEFDGHGVYGPEVLYDAADAEAPYKMWYSGRDGVFTRIGYATSTDGLSWTKQGVVVDVGLPGSRDSFTAAQPSVLRDSSVWKMWYEGDDSNQKAILYATSTDGVTWSKGGAVILPSGGNVEFGVFAPTVWKSGTSFQMLLGGRKEVSGGVLQTKLLSASSDDGVSWSLGNIAVNSGSNSFDATDLNSPDVLEDPGAGASAFKLYYAGRAVDAGGNYHTRIGLSQTSSGSGWQGGKFDGAGFGDSVLDISPLAEAFDARQASGPSAAPASTGYYAGAYWGVRGMDFKPRLGAASSTDGAAWTKAPTTRTDRAILPLGSGGQFDAGGHRDPSLLRAVNGAGVKDWFVYYTATSTASTPVRSIGSASTEELAGLTGMPDNEAWGSKDAELAPDGTGFDGTGVSHPSVVADGASYVMFFTGHASNGATAIGRVAGSAPDGPFTTSRQEVTLTGTPTCDADGARDPVVALVAPGDWRMLYVGRSGTTTATCYATSADGLTWERKGAVLTASRIPGAFDEDGIEPAGLLADGAVLRAYTTGIDDTGRTRGGAATTAFPPVAGQVPSGWATYQLGDTSTPAQDFQRITRTSSGTGVELWMSVLQPYSSGATEYWSDWFPVTEDATSEELNFLLTVQGVRWQARLRGPAGAPSLDKVDVEHANVSFAASGSAVTTDITPPDGFALQSWTSLVVDSAPFFGTGTAGAAATVLDAGTGETLVAATPLTTNGEQTIALGIGADRPKLRIRFDLTSDGATARIVRSARVTYAALQPGATPTPTPEPPPPPPPPPPPVLSLAVAKPTIVFGRTATLTGTLTAGGAAVAGQAVAIQAQPLGAAAPVQVATATTDAAGAFTAAVKPTRKTTYTVTFAGAATPPAVTVAVRHRVALRVAVRGGKATFKGSIAPKHKRRAVTIQRKRGKRWVRVARVRTNKRSRFVAAKRLTTGRYRFRAITGADKQHAAGRSAARRVTVR